MSTADTNFLKRLVISLVAAAMAMLVTASGWGYSINGRLARIEVSIVGFTAHSPRLTDLEKRLTKCEVQIEFLQNGGP